MTQKPVAIIDIGSNSVRLVVYAGATRIPWIIFNEKVLAGLGQTIASTGALPDEAQQRALAALRRFRTLADEMGVARTLVVAMAAVRDASNGAQFLDLVRAIGFSPMMLSGEQEAVMAGQGVLSAIPEADGIVADLGGGSLELAEVGQGKVHRSASFPLGVLRVEPMIRKGEGTLARKIAKAIQSLDLRKRAQGRPLYLVGGSWRALARLDMVINDYPLPITHHYEMSPGRPAELQGAIESLSKTDVKNVPSLSLARVPMLPYANRILKTLADELRPTSLIVSSFGIREGLLYSELDPATRAQDPLLEAAREAGQGLARFGEHGDLLDRWIAPIFDDEPAAARLRLAACLLADIAWQAHPDFRAERGVDMALHGNWVGVDSPGRVMIAQALFSNFGGAGRFGDLDVALLCHPSELERASQWGLAMRLGQRLGGGVASSLQHSRLRLSKAVLRLELENGAVALRGEAIERRLRTLASALGRKPEVAVS